MLSQDPIEWERKIRKAGQKRDDFVKLAKYLPVKPLLDRFPPDTKPTNIANKLGVNVGTVRKWLKNPEATVLWIIADRIAIKKLGVHPANIWGELWWVPEGDDHTWAWKYIDDPEYWD